MTPDPKDPEQLFLSTTITLEEYLASEKSYSDNIKNLPRYQEDLIQKFKALTPELQERYQNQFDDLLQRSRRTLPLIDGLDIFKP